MLFAAAVPVLDTVMVCEELVWPTVTLPKASEPGDALMLGAVATPVPSMLTVALTAPEVKV